MGVVEGETKTEAGVGAADVVLIEAFAVDEAKLRNIAKIESALETLGRAGDPIRQRGGMPATKPLS